MPKKCSLCFRAAINSRFFFKPQNPRLRNKSGFKSRAAYDGQRRLFINQQHTRVKYCSGQMCTFIWPTNSIYKVFWHCKMSFIKVFKMLLKRQYLYSSIFYQKIWGVFWACSGWLVLLHFFKKKILGVFRACCFLL